MVRALIIEDNAAFRQLLKELLCTRFVDIRLPGKNGLQITKEIRERHSEAVIVILTYYDLPEHREAAFRYGANYFLTKGSSTDDVVNLVASILSTQLDSLD